MTFVCGTLNNGAMVLFLYGSYLLMVMRRLHLESDLPWTQQQIQVPLIVQEGKAAISMAKEIVVRNLANKVTKIVRYISTCVEIMKKVLNFVIAFEK